MKTALKSRHFWGGVILTLALVTVFPQFSPRSILAKPRKAG